MKNFPNEHILKNKSRKDKLDQVNGTKIFLAVRFFKYFYLQWPSKELINVKMTQILTRFAIFSFRKGLMIAKMPLNIRGSFIMLTAFIRMGNPS